MKLQAQPTKKDGKYPKYVIVLPKEAIEKAGFKKGDELEAGARKGEIRLRKK